MRILITGTSGMLGATIVKKWSGRFEVFATGKNNFTNNPAKNFMAFDLLSDSYDVLLNWAKPDVIIHCAAITNVDYCEDNTEQAMAVNAESVNKFLKYGSDARMIFISSDAVFPDGIHMATGKDKTSPENIYGKTKVTGEKYIKDASGNHIAIRTTIVGKNINPLYQVGGGINGAELTSAAFGSVISWFPYILSVVVFLFSFSTMISWYYYGDKGWKYLFGDSSIKVYQAMYLGCVVLGSVASLGNVIDFSDMMILSCGFPNIIGAMFLLPVIKPKLAEYWNRYQEGIFKVYK